MPIYIDLKEFNRADVSRSFQDTLQKQYNNEYDPKKISLAKRLNIANSMLIESTLLLAMKITSSIYGKSKTEIASMNSKIKILTSTSDLMASSSFSQSMIILFAFGILQLVC